MIALVCAAVCTSTVRAQSSDAPASGASVSVPASRAAKAPYAITIHGPIDEWTVVSVQRRIEIAERSGADAIIIELDTPGGELQAMLLISSSIKRSKLRTIAWVNQKALSAGAVIALACGQIVVAEGGVLGDALPIQISMLEGFKEIPDAEREKFLGPVISDLVDSARRNAHDEVLVQGFVRRGVELWLIENPATGERHFVTAAEYEAAVGEAPTRGTPHIPAVTGPVTTSQAPPSFTGGGRSRKRTPVSGPVVGFEPTSQLPSAEPEKPYQRSDATSYVPAGPDVSAELASQVNQELAIRGRQSTRPNFASPQHAGKYRLVEYVASGRGVLTFATSDLLRYQIATAKVDSDAQMTAFVGAPRLTRLDETWSEGLARFLDNFFVKGILIAIFLIALFIEMTHPGVVLPGAIAALCVMGLVLPPMLASMSAWWMLASIVVGILLVVVELFLFPGIIVCGLMGVVLVFAGLIGAVIGGPGTVLSGGGGDGAYAITTLLLSFLAAGGGIWFVWRNLPSLPVFNRLVLKDDEDSSTGTLLGAMRDDGPVKRGAVGVAITPLRPAGRVQIGDHIHDVVADVGFIGAGTQVRVVSSDQFRTIVEPVKAMHAAEIRPT